MDEQGGLLRLKQQLKAADGFCLCSFPCSKNIELFSLNRSANGFATKPNEQGFLFMPFDPVKNEPLYFSVEKIKSFSEIPVTEIFSSVVNNNLPKLSQLQEDSEDTYSDKVVGISTLLNENEKAVLSRTEKMALPANFDIYSYFKKLVDQYSSAFNFIFVYEDICWIGATPELLLSYENGIAESMALAGTQKKQADKTLDQYQWGDKEIEEHQMVADYILKKLNDNKIDGIETIPMHTVSAGPVVHLKTQFRFNLSNNIEAILNSLHPTPAVSGLPVPKALDIIQKYEEYNRSYYTGYLGFYNDKSGQIFVNLRSMRIFNNAIQLFIGGGLTKDSDADAEYQETVLKASTLKNLI